MGIGFLMKMSHISNSVLWIGPVGGPKNACNALNAVDGSIASFSEGLAVEVE